MKNKLGMSLLIGALALPVGISAATASHTTVTKSDPNDTRDGSTWSRCVTSGTRTTRQRSC